MQAETNSHPLTQTFALVRRAQGGDRAALDALFARYYERVRRCVRARIGRRLRNVLESADILQQAFARAFATFDRFELRHDGSLLHWLAEIAARQVTDAADHWQAQRRRPAPAAPSLDAATGGAGEPLADRLASADTGPVDGTVRREHARLVEDCLDRLGEEYRRVLVLRDFDGLEWREVARLLGRNTESAARDLHARAMLQLAQCLRRHGVGRGPG